MVMKKLILILITTLTLTACTTNPMNVNSSNAPKSDMLDLYQSMPITEQNLIGKWQLENSPLILQFKHGTVSVLNGCNHLSADYQMINDKLTIGSPISTRMACEKSLMDIDSLAVKLLKGEIVLKKFMGSVPENIYLTINENGKSYKFSKVK